MSKLALLELAAAMGVLRLPDQVFVLKHDQTTTLLRQSASDPANPQPQRLATCLSAPLRTARRSA
jgi:hypothetical protein